MGLLLVVIATGVVVFFFPALLAIQWNTIMHIFMPRYIIHTTIVLEISE